MSTCFFYVRLCSNAVRHIPHSMFQFLAAQPFILCDAFTAHTHTLTHREYLNDVNILTYIHGTRAN